MPKIRIAEKMTLQNQQETLRLMGKIIPCLDEQYISMDIRDLVEVITKNPNRMTDIETVISSRSWGKYEGPIEVIKRELASMKS